MCKREINDLFIDEANHIYIAIPMYKLIECSDNYLNKSGSLLQFTRDEVEIIMLIRVLMILVFLILNHLNIEQLL